MRHCRLMNSTRFFAGLFGSLLFVFQLHAQTAPASQAPRQLSLGYDKAHEITLTGAVQEVFSERAIGTPAGLHLLVAGEQGIVDAHLGPFLSQETRDALQSGESVQIVGAMTKINGNEYLLARQLIMDGHTITIRTERGFLVHSLALRASSSQTATNGGVR
jgi:hypothetical protein